MKYDYNYYEAGVENGISGYQNYRWIPEISLPMAHHLIIHLGLNTLSKVLDFGCAKGFLVKAFHLLGLNNTFGADISSYAISNGDQLIRSHIHLIENIGDINELLAADKIDLVICKDVLEHVPIDQLPELLTLFSRVARKIFIAVPISADDISNKFIIPAYHNDVTHITIKSESFWRNLLTQSGWKLTYASNDYLGMKSNWTKLYPNGNLFLVGTIDE